MAVHFGLSEAMSLAIIVSMLLIAAPLPRSVIQTLLSLRPGWILGVAASATSLVPFFENAKELYEYRPRNEVSGSAYETDPRFLAHQVALLRSLVVGALLFSFALVSFLGNKMVNAQVATERMEKNLFATKKQAMAASDQSLKMLSEIDEMKSDGAADKTAKKLEAILTENVVLKKRAESAEKEVDIIKQQAKSFEREHERLINRIAELEKLLVNAPKEAKKDK